MPKVVDHKSRRAEVAKATIRVIARNSFEGLNMRAVAQEAGISYGSLFHYFETKEAVLLETVRYIAEQSEATLNETKRDISSPMATMSKLLIDDTVVDEQSFGTHAAWVSFLVQGIYDPLLAQQHERLHSLWLSTLQGLLGEAKARGEIRADVVTEDEALSLWLLCAGISQRSLLKPQSLPARKQRALIQTYLSKLTEL